MSQQFTNLLLRRDELEAAVAILASDHDESPAAASARFRDLARRTGTGEAALARVIVSTDSGRPRQ